MKKRNISTIILILVFLAGLSLLLYPTISDYWNSFHQTRAIVMYEENVADLQEELYQKYMDEARLYNQRLVSKSNRLNPTEKDLEEYNDLLNVTADGIMGYIEIPNIKCILPIYHGIDDLVLQVAIGHIPGTSLPVGGESSHCVISGHRGLPSAKLFTDLDKIVEGDQFLLQILGETLTYEVDQILIVEPKDVKELEITEGKDYCTLITCTPYGVNSHRLLVRGHRVDTVDDASLRVTADARQIEPEWVAPLVAVPILLVLLVVLLVKYRKR